ncbi:MAG: hypothetical protein AAFR04_10050 [Pseudomonadota bacterium]
MNDKAEFIRRRGNPDGDKMNDKAVLVRRRGNPEGGKMNAVVLIDEELVLSQTTNKEAPWTLP